MFQFFNATAKPAGDINWQAVTTKNEAGDGSNMYALEIDADGAKSVHLYDGLYFRACV